MMATTITYAQAVQRLRKIGTSRAEGVALQAMAADILAMRLCLNPKPLFDWGQKHGITLYDLARKKIDIPTEGMEIVGCFLDDIPLPATTSTTGA